MGHWYTPEGAPMHYIVGKNGKERGTTLRDARQLGLVPSVTTILKLRAAPQLTNWLVNQAYEQAMTTPATKEGERLEDYIARCKRNAAQDLEQTADIGSEIHAAIEKQFQGGRPAEKYAVTARAAQDAILEATGVSRGWATERTFTSDRGYGGAIDLSCTAGDGVIVDYKTKDFTEENAGKRMAFDNHVQQLAAYAHGIGKPNARLFNVFVSRQVPGLVRVHEWTADEAAKAWRIFELLLLLWQAETGHVPGGAVV